MIGIFLKKGNLDTAMSTEGNSHGGKTHKEDCSLQAEEKDLEETLSSGVF